MKREIASKLASAMLTGALAIGATGCTVKLSDPVTSESEVVNTDAALSESQTSAADTAPSDTEPCTTDVSEQESTTTPTLSDEITYPSVSKFVYTVDEGLGDDFKIPQLSMDSEEAIALNNQILNEFAEFYAINSEKDGYLVDYIAFDAFNGIYSIFIDYSFDSWGGFYKAYTFDANGHVYSNQELLSMAGIDEASFYEVAREATVKYMTNRSADSTPMVIDGQANPDHEFADLIAQDLSETDLRTDMVMFFLGGDLYIGQEIMPFADAHSSFALYTIPDGKALQ